MLYAEPIPSDFHYVRNCFLVAQIMPPKILIAEVAIHTFTKAVCPPPGRHVILFSDRNNLVIGNVTMTVAVDQYGLLIVIILHHRLQFL